MKRRNFLATTLTGLVGANVLQLQAIEKKTNKRSLRFVHLTDMQFQMCELCNSFKELCNTYRDKGA